MQKRQKPGKGEETKPSGRAERLFTESELELMKIVWHLGEATVREVHEALPKDRDLAYTSVATFLKILEQKSALSSEKGERAIVYRPRLSRSEYEAMTLRHVTDRLFSGNPASVVMRLLDESELTKEELASIRSALNQRLKS